MVIKECNQLIRKYLSKDQRAKMSKDLVSEKEDIKCNNTIK